MFTRFLLALLLAAFALPAPAAVPACHGGAEAAMTHHQSPAPDEPEAVHACIGCIPPAGLDAPDAGGPSPTDSVRPVAFVRAFDLGAHGPPDLPPPRRG